VSFPFLESLVFEVADRQENCECTLVEPIASKVRCSLVIARRYDCFHASPSAYGSAHHHQCCRRPHALLLMGADHKQHRENGIVDDKVGVVASTIVCPSSISLTLAPTHAVPVLSTLTARVEPLQSWKSTSGFPGCSRPRRWYTLRLRTGAWDAARHEIVPTEAPMWIRKGRS